MLDKKNHEPRKHENAILRRPKSIEAGLDMLDKSRCLPALKGFDEPLYKLSAILLALGWK